MFGERKKRLQDKRAALLAHSQEIISKCEEEDREATEAETQSLDANEADLKKLSADIARLERLEEIERETSKATVGRNVPAETEQKKEETDPDTGVKLATKIIIPATARLQHSKHFSKPEDAYLAGQWFLATIFGKKRAALWCKDHGVELLAAAEGDNSLGGYLVPTPLEQVIIDLRETYGVFRQEAMVWPMASDSTTIPRRESGLTAYFVGENTAMTESTVGWGAVELQARKLAVMTLYPTELDEDAIIMLADHLAGEIAYAFALKEDQCGFIGDGTSTYGGTTGAATKINDGNHAGSIVGATAGNDSFEELDLVDFEAVVGKLPQYAENNAKWYISKAGYAASMLRLLDAAGGNTTMQIAAGGVKQFLGYPVVISQVLNSTLGTDASKIKCLFGDLRMAATLGTRRGVTIKSSEERYIELDQIVITGTERVAINVHELGDGTNPGPLVALKSAA